MSTYDLAYIFKAIDNFSPAVKKISASMEKFEVQMKKSADNVKKFSDTVQKTGKILFKGLVLPMAAAATYALKNSEQFKTMQIRLESVAGSAKNAAKVMASVKEMSLSTGLSPEGLNQTATKLLAAGYGMDKINEKLKQMSVLAVGSGRDITEIASGLIRMKTVGYAQGRFMARMSQQGIPLVKAFKEYYHLSDKAWNNLTSKKLDFKLIEPVLDSMTKKGSDFYESYRKMLMTTGTSADRVHNALRFIAADFGDALFKVYGIEGGMKGIADRLAELEPKIKAWLEANPEVFKMAVNIGLIGAALISIASVLKTITWGFGLLAGYFGAMARASGPILAVLAMWEGAKGVDFSSFNQSMLTALKQFGGGETKVGWKTVGGALSALGESAGTAQPGTISSGASLLGFNPSAGAQQISSVVSAPSLIRLMHEGNMVGSIPLAVKSELGRTTMGSY